MSSRASSYNVFPSKYEGMTASLTAQSFFLSQFLGAFAKNFFFEKKATFKIRHVLLSVRMEQFGSHWTGFHEMLVF
jgi:hypothetical protein